MSTLTYHRSQLILGGTLLTFLLVAIGLVFVGFAENLYYDEEFQRLLIGVSKLFAPHLAIVLGAILATEGEKQGKRRVPMTKVAVALTAVIMWGTVVVLRLGLFVRDMSEGDTVGGIEKFLTLVPENFGYLVTGVMTFFFVGESSGERNG